MDIKLVSWLWKNDNSDLEFFFSFLANTNILLINSKYTNICGFKEA